MLGMVKILVNGVVAALHRYDGAQLELLAERLSERLVAPADHLARPRRDSARATDHPDITAGGRPDRWLLNQSGRRRLHWPRRDRTRALQLTICALRRLRRYPGR